jgi:polyhydroxyalkanoate synthase
LAALDAIEKATGEREVNAIGYCIGGTLLFSTLAYLSAKRDKRVKSVTGLTTMLDFTNVGELSVFIDEEQFEHIDKGMETKGYLEGHHMAGVFNLMRANDLIWSFVIKNYLLGEDPFPFDLLYWNADSTCMPKAMHTFYLRNMYLNNKLKEPGSISMLGQPIDLGKIKVPAYFLSAKEDHIAPWKSTYAGTHLPATADEWLAGAQEHQGSWWTHWLEWIKPLAGEQVDARVPGDRELTPIEDAPGSYVLVRSE